MTAKRRKSPDTNTHGWLVDHRLLDICVGAPPSGWSIDQKLLGIQAIDPTASSELKTIRPWLTIVQDEKGMVWVAYISIKKPSAKMNARLLLQAIAVRNLRQHEQNAPKVLYTDNGIDFGSMQGAGLPSGLELVRTAPGQPIGKGKIERIFETLDGYVSNMSVPQPPFKMSIEQLQVAVDGYIRDYNQRFTDTDAPTEE